MIIHHYRSSVARGLRKAPYYAINMLHQVHSKLLLSLGRMKNEGQPGLHLQGRITLVLQYWDAEKADVEMAEDGKTEGDDSNSDGHWQGRKLTATETRHTNYGKDEVSRSVWPIRAPMGTFDHHECQN